MGNSKFLSDGGWKDVAAKNNVKDNGLLKKLADIKKVGDDKHDDALKLLDEALKLTGQLKKDKKTAPAAGKYLDELAAAVETAVREVGKAKAEADKAAKAEAQKKAQAEAAAKKADDDDDEDAESPELLTTKLKPLLRLVAKGETMHTLVAKSGKKVVVMLSRKPIPPARRKMLADQLGGGSTKYYPGHCALDAGATTFVLKAEVAGMSKLVKAALLEQTGLRLNKVKCRGEDGDDDDGDDEGDVQAAEPGGPAAAGDAFKTRLASLLPRIKGAMAAGGDVAQQAKAKTTEAGTMAGKNDFAEANALLDQVEELLASSAASTTEAAPSLVQLAKARLEWNSARAHAVSELARLKKILRHEYRDATNEQAALAKALQRVDSTIDAMDDELNDRLDQVVNAQAAQRKDLTAAAAVALQRLIKLVSNDEILQNIDGNELAPEMVIAAPLRAKLTDIAQSLR